ncbi:polyprenol reductase 2 isoform X2 [Ricinus communis]|uniref:polyprenol reductase 2 isoform X2 n=1 Tax=Ricinus communis TaxID=3988 RepID=UPI00077231A2|nr:polyprenol reductase 2 isoform X2 [Ricinus communis]|eukprot:XP_015570788.1 polyprenol reductase 2 isoform X2 [Ricinus communis]
MEFGLVGFLRVAWIAGILPIVIASLPFPKLGSFHRVILGFSKRGKIMESSSQYKFTVPQRFFTHFYVVAVVWTTFLLVATWLFAYKTAPLISEPFLYSNISSYLAGGSNIFSFRRSRLISVEHRYRVWLSVFLLLLMEVQALRRLLENSYVFNYSPSARMHIFAYLTGLFFYTAAPLSLCATCALEVFKFGKDEAAQFIIKGKSAMHSIEFDWWDFVNPLLKLGWYQWIGATLFLWGSIHQHHCHTILGSLREHGRKVDEYVIPHGDWFEIVSSPHYLAEIVSHIRWFGVC